MATNKYGVVQKRWLTAFVLSLIFGVFGVDRFYLGKPGTAILKLLTFGGLGIWALIDFIMITTKSVAGVEWVDDKADDKKKALIIFCVIFAIGFIMFIATNGSRTATITNSNLSPNTSTNNTSTTNKPKEDLSKVAKEYTLTAGYYTAGIDLPAGKADIVAVSGTGNLSSSNIYDGGINEMFGVDDGSGLYTSSFNNLKFTKSERLSLNSDLVIKLTFKQIDSGFSGRIYDEDKAKEFTNGNFTAGEDFAEGVYKIAAVSGSGNLSSSNIYDGGVNEMFGVDDGSGLYNSQFLNAKFGKGVTLKISGGVTVKLIPVR